MLYTCAPTDSARLSAAKRRMEEFYQGSENPDSTSFDERTQDDTLHSPSIAAEFSNPIIEMSGI
jgi:hypothetical protein